MQHRIRTFFFDTVIVFLCFYSIFAPYSPRTENKRCSYNVLWDCDIIQIELMPDFTQQGSGGAPDAPSSQLSCCCLPCP